MSRGRSWTVWHPCHATFAAVILGVTACPAEGTASRCPPEADAPVTKIGASWSALYDHFKRFAQCDDGAVYEGFSEAVVMLLGTSWKELPRLAELVRQDDAFRSFVMKHVDDIAGEGQLRKVRDNSRTACPAGLEGLCKQIGAAADRALGEGVPKK